MSRVVTVRAPAKINLSLRVLGVRPDGYHELRTVFQSVALADTLVFRTWDGPFRLTCDHPDVPRDGRNLVWLAAARLWAELGRPGDPGGVSVSIRKRIPLQAGLGGGSADAAAALAALARLWNARLPAAALQRVAAGLGADVPFMLSGGTALGLGRGDEIHPLPDPPRRWVVVACPPFGVSTAEAYRWFDEPDVPAGAIRRAGDSARLAAASWTDDLSQVANDLESCVVRRHPVIGEAVARLRAAGAAAAAMSGSGSAVFGLFIDAAGARRAVEPLAQPGWTVFVTRTLAGAEAAARLQPTDRDG
ncbi:MAG: 4-(cytidine 5'-diphospho)-2-C-methyl-D-erythritol kinase [Acidobacteria bacterium]|nr:4-(cytidine 5'-diphospho)-2-C-methyl-D-erythritol kinase [Acidobacteriota bacterium]